MFYPGCSARRPRWAFLPHRPLTECLHVPLVEFAMAYPRGNILLLLFFLAVHMVSPLCHSMVSGGMGSAGAGIQTAADRQNSTPPLGEPEEHCWFQTAHLFNKAWTPDAPGVVSVSLLIAVFSAMAIFVVLMPRPVTTDYFLPDRSPPSRALLQIYRI